jgi:hypothetical protein
VASDKTTRDKRAQKRAGVIGRNGDLPAREIAWSDAVLHGLKIQKKNSMLESR